tara:strand:+ start:209594 stop:209905 length:312 start_codon:yes stop_codon:yes gene_type:complete
MEVIKLLIILIVLLVVALIVMPPFIKNNLKLKITLNLILIVICGVLSSVLAYQGNYFGCAIWGVYSILFVVRLVTHRKTKYKLKGIQKNLEKLIDKSEKNINS